ncbi:hypothetical protein T01_13105 [Trichinella spiralis]|uniref:Uncharacterized protein n=1 Tax=Trichinella spiralis TaxID=6334 RepID=A0A0V1BPM9_TRISP|nr:hypothetical protein T01_13105 [Trichinella spiralis]
MGCSANSHVVFCAIETDVLPLFYIFPEYGCLNNVAPTRGLSSTCFSTTADCNGQEKEFIRETGLGGVC